MPDQLDDPERIIATAIERHARGDIPALARAILSELWDAGFDVTPRHDVAVSHYSEADELATVEQRLADRPGDLFQHLADEPRNERIRDKITRLRARFDELGWNRPTGLTA